MEGRREERAYLSRKRKREKEKRKMKENGSHNPFIPLLTQPVSS